MRLPHEVGSERPAGWGDPPSEMASGADLDLHLPPCVGTSFLGLPLATLPAWVSQGHAHGTGLLAKGSSASRNRAPPTPAHLGPVSEMGGGWQERAGHILHLATPGCVGSHQEML